MKHFQLTILALLFSCAAFAISPITGTNNVCAGSTTTLADADAGGVWTSSAPGTASVGSSSGIVMGVAAGPATITYTTGSGFATMAFTVHALPAAYTLYFAGSGSICSGSPGANIFLSGSQIGVNYQLFRTGIPVGSPLAGTGSLLSFGAQTAAGNYTVVATNTTTTCTRTLGPVTLTVLPTPGAIGGPSSVCLSASVTLTNATSGGTWSSSNPSVASIGTAGVVTGLAVGTTTISYVMPSGCYVTTNVNVINLVLPITGPTVACTGSSIILSSGTGGGTWTSSNPSIATIGSSSGIVTGMATGVATISYSVGSGCGVVSRAVSVRPTPAVITGITSICSGSVSTLHDATPGGTWSSGNTSVAIVGSVSGVVSSVSAGSATISYTVAGCSRTTTMSIDPQPVISGATGVCVGDTIRLSSSLLASWTSSNLFAATINSSGVVSGLNPGATTITANSFSTGCVSTRVISVTSSCSGTPAGGAANATLPLICSGNANTLYLTGASTACGVSHQWQYSPDSLSWFNITGGIYDMIVVHPQAKTYYRCRLSCYSSGLFAYSAVVRVNVYNSISSNAIYNSPTTSCTGPDFHFTTCGIAPGTNVKTYFGDGTSDSTHLSSTSPDSSATADIFHLYNLPGTYTVKQVLRNGTTPQDSITYSYTYNHCRTLPVAFYYDANNNCINDDAAYSFYEPITTEVDSNGVHIDTITSVNGFYYRALGGIGTIYQFRVIGYDPGLHLSCPGSGIILDTITAFVNAYPVKYIGFDCSTATNFDLGVHTNMSCATTTASGTIYVYNRFCTPQTTVVTMNFSPKYDFGSATPAPFSVSGHTVTWHISPLTVYNSIFWPAIRYSLRVTGGPLTAGDTAFSNYSISPTGGDADPTNNNVALINTIRGSYDPNMISVKPEGYIIPCTQLKYTVDFENTGNDTARNIAVIDTLPDFVDPYSLKIVSATSEVNMAIVKFGSRKLVKFDFPGINLPDSSHHNLCHGQVVFTVKAKQGLADGININNRASIYFDVNAPVLTNTVTNIIGISPITGPSNVCNTMQIQLSNASENGIWSASNPTAAVLGGLVTGVSAGTDTISYTLSNSCASKTATKIITIDPTLTPAVSIATSTGMGDTLCDGALPVFTATPVNGGSTPTYNWQVNGVSSGTGGTFSYAPPVNGDVVSVVLTSDANCAVPDTATTGIVLTVVAPYIPPITLNAYPGIFVLPGTTVTFTATVTGSGPTPDYQWLLNGSPVPGATTDTFVSSTLVTNDSVTCVATGTDLCKFSTFNSFIMTVGNTGTTNLNKNAQMALFPNPNKGEFTVRGKTGIASDEDLSLEITNMIGQVVYRSMLRSQNGMINEQVNTGNMLVKGVYILNLRSGADNTVFRFTVE